MKLAMLDIWMLDELVRLSSSDSKSRLGLFNFVRLLSISVVCLDADIYGQGYGIDGVGS